jgi:hypothetical protein
MSCPPGFEVGLANTCRVICPADFKYIQTGNTEKCVAASDNRYFVMLQDIPQGASATAFSDEQARFLAGIIEVAGKVKKEQDALAKLRTVSSDGDVSAHHQQIKSTHGVAGAYAEAISTLKPLRPPTQPTDDIMNTKLSIRDLSARDIRTLQICLFFVVLALFEYMLFPASIVHGLAFFTLCVGFSLAIYLSNK